MLRSSSSALLNTLQRTPALPRAARSYAAQTSTSAKKAKPGRPIDAMAGDPRTQLIKSALFESDPSEEERLEALLKVIPSPEAHETIERAWQLHLRHKRETHQAEIHRKYASMRAAMDLLEQTDKELFRKACGKAFTTLEQADATNARLNGLVPREWKVPTDLPAGKMWNADWKAPQPRKLDAAKAEERPAA
ncbi:mitochondrial ribosomal protein subunit L28 [Rhodotorula toruloides]|uniref:Large ribosomal subunit protein mL40 n=1 Tax=Rhodotorula toruloides TaxID=5286 RepID=A0A511KD15_RHOTO|nr:mitochondrial ribosomal protein subunit L28 [Rhodotorula toruloides]